MSGDEEIQRTTTKITAHLPKCQLKGKCVNCKTFGRDFTFWMTFRTILGQSGHYIWRQEENSLNKLGAALKFSRTSLYI